MIFLWDTNAEECEQPPQVVRSDSVRRFRDCAVCLFVVWRNTGAGRSRRTKKTAHRSVYGQSRR